MAESVRGINVVIGAETTGLSKALSDVNKRSRDIQSELKQVERLLQFDPSNTELLAQKQKLLGEAIDNAREKLDRLRSVQEQVAAQFQRGEISEGQYRAFQREIVKAEQELRKFEERLESTKKTADEVAESFKNVGEKLANAGKTMTAAVTTPIITSGALLLKSAADAEAAQGKLQAALGLTAEEAEKLGNIAREVWKEGFGESIEEANQAIISVRHNMAGVAEQDLAAVAKGAMTIAQVFDQDVREVTAAAGVMMKNFGISGQEALDIITVGFQRGGDFSGELLDTLREYAPQFKSLGLSADQAMAMLIKGVEAGAWNLDKVGDAMKEFNIRAQDGSKTTAEGFAMIGLNAEEMAAAIAAGGEEAEKAFLATVTALANMEDPLKQNLAGVALFGTQWEDVRANVITALAEGKNGLSDFRGATDEATRALMENNPGLALTQAFRSLQAAIGPALLPLADILNNTIVPAVKNLAEWFANLSPSAQMFVVALAGIAAAIGPILLVLGPLISTIGTLATLFASTGAAIGAIATPVGIAIAAIGALVAAGVLIVKNWDTIKQKTQEVWQRMSSVIGPGVQAVISFITQKFQQLQAWWNQIWPQMKDAFANIWNAIKAVVEPIIGAIVQLMQWAWPLIKTLIVETWENVKGVIDGALKVIMGLLKSFASLFTGDWKGLWEGVKQIFSGAVELIWNAFQLWGTGKILKFVGFLGGQLGRIFRTIWDEASSIFSAGLNRVFSLVSSIFNRIISFVTNLGSSFYNAGKGLIEQMKRGIERAADAVIDSVRRLAGKVRDFLPFSPAKVGPLSDLDKLDFGGPIAKSIQAAMPRIQGMLDEMLSLPVLNVNMNVPSIDSTAPAVGASPIIVQNMVVRNDDDIKRIARELHWLQQTSIRARGGRA